MAYLAGPACPADWDGDRALTSNDYFTFLDSCLANNADLNFVGPTVSDDFFAFLAAFFEGC